MAKRRGVLIGVTLSSAVVVALAATAVLSAAAENSPTATQAVAVDAPYSATTFDGGAGSNSIHGSHVFEAPFLGGYTPSSRLLALARIVSGVSWSIQATPPLDAMWTAGTTYPVTRLAPTSTTARIIVLASGANNTNCSQEEGTLAVHEATYSGTVLTAFAGTYSVSCDTAPGPLTGEIRWNSTVDYVAIQAEPSTLTFFDEPAGAAPQTVTFTGMGSQPTTFATAALTAATPGAFTITADTCSNATVAYGQTCGVTITAHPTASGPQTAGLVLPDNSAAGHRYVELSAGVTPPQPTPSATPAATTDPTTAPTTGPTTTPTPTRVNIGNYYPHPSQRILDTRSGLGAARAPIGPDSTLNLHVTPFQMPTSGVSAVVLNITATGGNADTYVTVYPSGTPRPTASSLNSTSGWAGANLVTVPLGAGGNISLYNHVGTIDLIADMVGYYAADTSIANQYGSGGRFFPLIPKRVFDSRRDWNQKVPAGFTVRVPVSFGGAGSDEHIRAFVVNVTAVDPDGPGYLTAWAGYAPTPTTSTLNYVKGATVPNLAIVPTRVCSECGDTMPSIGIYTHQNAHIVVDIVGAFDDNTLPGGLVFTAHTPTRIVDTRTGLGGSGALGQFATATFNPPADVANSDTWALAMNVTAVTPTASTFLTVWPADSVMPTSSNLNPAAGQTIPNAVYGGVGSPARFNVYNNVGRVDLVVDVVGSFALPALTVGETVARTNARSGTPAKAPLAMTVSAGASRLEKTD